MTKRILVFFPQNPYPPQSGAHYRVLEVLAGLKQLGCHITLLSSTYTSPTKWTGKSIAALKEQWVHSVFIYAATRWDYRFTRRAESYYRWTRTRPSIDSFLQSPPGMRWWFRRLAHRVRPDVVLMNYAYWDGLLHYAWPSKATRIIDTLDLVSLNRAMQAAITPYVSEGYIDPAAINDEVVEDGFFDRLGLSVDPKEFKVFDHYDYTIAITQQEAEIIKRGTRRSTVVTLPMTFRPAYVTNSYAGGPLFTTGPNLFNVQGYLYFVKRVLPYVLREEPSFLLQVMGMWPPGISVAAAAGIVLRGFVPDLSVEYATASFSVCPVFAGTGQQIKIVEAMAHGLPVVALSPAAARSPIRNGVNGLIVSNAADFGAQVVRLWRDRDLCQRLGQAARETIAQEFSTKQLTAQLSMLIGERAPSNRTQRS